MTTLDAWPLNTTKLHPPRVTATLVARPRLFQQLDNGVLGALTLVCASVGYGKTTLVSSWLKSRAVLPGMHNVPAAWLSLNEYDSDLTVFVRYFCAALRTIFPDTCSQTLALLLAPQPLPLDVLVATLSNEIAELPSDFILVLDDYHTVSGVEVPDLLSSLTRHWPQPLHLVLLTRRNPPLPLARLRAMSELAEVRTHDLQFTSEEVAQYLVEVLGRLPDEAVLAQLEFQIEGWIIGLRLATLSLPRDLDAAALATLAKTDTNIFEYLFDEVLSKQPADVIAFLFQTALLDRFCIPLYEEIMGEREGGRDARACLAWLEETNFLLVALDERREWYRYHHLVQDLLRVRAAAALGPDQVTGLQRRAAAWFVQHGLIEEALQQAVAARDLELSARLMQQGLCSVLNYEDAATLRHWLALLPEDFRQRRLGPMLVEAWVRHFSFRSGELPPLLRRIETLLAGEAEPLAADELQLVRGQFLVLHAQIAYLSNRAAEGTVYAQDALAILPSWCKFLRGVAIFYLAANGRASGQGDAVEPTLWLEYLAAADKSDVYAARVLGALCFTELQSGKLEQTRQRAALLLEQAKRAATVFSEGWAHYWLGMVHYEWNELAAAAHHFQVVIHLRYSLHSLPAREGLLGMVRVQIAAGDIVSAVQGLALLRQYDLDVLGYECPDGLAAWAELHYLQGDRVSAGRWVDTFSEPVPEQALVSTHAAHITRARLLLARGAPADVQAAKAIIAALYAIADRTCNTRFKIVLLALRALALEAEKQHSAADASLREALELAQPGSFIRTFVDLGLPMQVLVVRLARQGSAPGSIDNILAAFAAAAKGGLPSNGSQKTPFSSSYLSCAVTRRELDILILLRERLSAKEIARELGISTVTVNSHCAHLYRKLGVNTRRDAITKAEELNLLPAH